LLLVTPDRDPDAADVAAGVQARHRSSVRHVSWERIYGWAKDEPTPVW
jgi:hypothetical protein